jgi:hypothetical protein
MLIFRSVAFSAESALCRALAGSVVTRLRPHLERPSRETPEDHPWGSSRHIGPPWMAGMPGLQEQIPALCRDALGRTLRGTAAGVVLIVGQK